MTLLVGLIPQGFDAEGRSVPYALMYTYDAGTYTPKPTYSNPGLTLQNPNPLEADGAGRFFNVYLGAGAYRVEIRDRAGVVLWEQDDYTAGLDGTDLANIDADIALANQALSKTFYIGIDTGVADAYELEAAGVQVEPDAYSNAMIIGFSPANINTGPSTVDVAGLGIKNLVNSDGSALPAGFLALNTVYQFIYIVGQFYFYTRSGLTVTDQIKDLAVTTPKIAELAVTTPKINSKAVTLPKMADGTAYKLIGYGSDTVATTYTNPVRLLSSGTPTAAASLQFVLSTLDPIQSTDGCYLVRFMGIQPAGDDVILYLTLSADAGSTYGATLYYSACAGNDTGSTARSTFVSSGTQIEVAGSGVAGKSLSNAANETCSMDMIFYNVNTGTSIVPTINWTVSFYNADGALTRQSGGASRLSAEDYDAIKFTWEGGGNFAAVGRYYLFKEANVI